MNPVIYIAGFVAVVAVSIAWSFALAAMVLGGVCRRLRTTANRMWGVNRESARMLRLVAYAIDGREEP